MKRILAATDFSPLSQQAVRRAALLAARDNAEVLIVHAMPRLSALQLAFGAHDSVPTRMRAAAEDSLAALLQTARQMGAGRVRGEIVTGSAHRGVVDAANNFNADLLVIGAHGKGMLQQLFLGGAASLILTHATCPVLVVRQATIGDYRHALAAVDLGPRSEAVLRTALAVAGPAGVTAVHAFQAPFEVNLRYKGFAEAEIARYVEQQAETVRDDLRTLLSRAGLADLQLDSRIVHGHPNPALPETASELAADLIVAARHGGSHLEEMVMGSVSKFLVYYAPCDVLVV